MLPLAIAINAIPIIAFAPIANNWLGITSPLSKMAVAAALVYFPIMINVLRGLTQVEGSALELMRSYAAGPAAVTTQLRVPNALPYFLTGLKIATTLSLIGAVVGEYFGGLSATLGRVVVSAASSLRFDVTWAAILVVSLTGIVLYLLVVALERVLIPWHPSLRGDRARPERGRRISGHGGLPPQPPDARSGDEDFARSWRAGGQRQPVACRLRGQPAQARRRRRRRPAQRRHRSACSCSGRTRPSSPATTPPSSRATTKRKT